MRIYLLTTLRNYIVKSGTEVIMNGNNNWKTPQRVDIYSNYKKRSLELNLYQKALILPTDPLDFIYFHVTRVLIRCWKS